MYNTDNKKLNFIFVSLQRIFTDRESTATSIAKELAKRHNVLYVNPPIDRRAYWLGSDDPFINDHIVNIRRRAETLENADANLWTLYPKKIMETINCVPITPIFSFLNRVNTSPPDKEIQKTTKKT